MITESTLNGNFVSPEFHALTDPKAYQCMNPAWKAANPIYPAWLRQMLRMPGWMAGGAGGAAWGAAGMAASRNCPL